MWSLRREIQSVLVSSKEQKYTETKTLRLTERRAEADWVLVHRALTNSEARSLCPWSVRPAPLRLGSSRTLSGLLGPRADRAVGVREIERVLPVSLVCANFPHSLFVRNLLFLSFFRSFSD